MEQLGFLAVPAQQVENEAHEKNIEFGHERPSVAGDIEKKLLQQRNEELKSEIEELKRKRLENMKANQRLLSIFDSKEEAWKVEKRKLEQELQDAIKKADSIIYTNSDAIVEHHDPAMVVELREKKHKLEIMLKNAMVEAAAWKRNAALKAKEKMNVDVVLRKVTEELLKLQKEVEDRDDIISALSKERYSLEKNMRLRDTVEAELKAMELQLSNAKSLLKQHTDVEQTREAEVVKWKKLYLAMKAEFEIVQRQYTQSYALNANAGGGEIGRDMSLGRSRRVELDLERKHFKEIKCLEREIKVKDDKMKMLRMQFVDMEKNALDYGREIDNLGQVFHIARKDKIEAENEIKSMQQILSTYHSLPATPYTTSNSCNHIHEICTSTREHIVQVGKTNIRLLKVNKDQML